MATAVLIPVEEYLANTYEPDCDYVEGRLEERNVGELDHGTLQMQIGHWFLQHSAEWKLRVSAESRMRLSSGRFRIPDVLVMRLEQPREPVLTTPPLIAIEVMSSCDSLRSLAPRLRDYAVFGVENIWVLDPAIRKAYAWSSGDLHETDDLRVAASEIVLPLPEIFGALDQ